MLVQVEDTAAMGTFPLSTVATNAGITTLTINMARFQEKGTSQTFSSKKKAPSGSSAAVAGLPADSSTPSPAMITDGKREAKASFDRWHARVPGMQSCCIRP